MRRRDVAFLRQFLIRIVASIAIVMLVYNPSGQLSYYHWLTGAEPLSQNLPLKVLAGVALLIALAVLIRNTLNSIRVAGAILAGFLVASVVWLLVDWNVLSLEKPGVLDWIVLVGVGFVLGVGLSWAIIRRRLSGQLTVDEAEESHDHG